MAITKPFRFGVVGIRAADRQEWRAKAQKVETLGFATVLIWDHLDELFAPIPALVAAAEATTSLRLGTLVLANDFRHPVILAKEAATLDLLSEGRLELGLGAGWNQAEFEQAGIPFEPAPVRVRRLAESIQVMKRLWGPAPVSYQGKYYTVRDLQGKPEPVQRPHPPLMIGGARKQMLALAAQEADIVSLATKVYSDGRRDFVASTGPHIAEKMAWVRESAGPRALQLEFHIHVGGVIITPDRVKTAEQLGPTVGLTADQLLDCPQALIGTEEEIIQDLQQRRREYGLSYISVDERFMEALAPIIDRLAGQ